MVDARHLLVGVMVFGARINDKFISTLRPVTYVNTLFLRLFHMESLLLLEVRVTLGVDLIAICWNHRGYSTHDLSKHSP